MNTNLWLVIPCYNEEEVLAYSMARIRGLMDQLIEAGEVSEDSKIILVDDGSTDRTWHLIREASYADSMFCGIKLSRNQGHQNALLAGMMYACGRCDCMISLDADLQDDISVIPKFLEKYRQGCQIVYGVRNCRDTDDSFKKTTASFFYKLMRFMGADTVYDHADYRLMSSKALEALKEFEEVNLFLRGIVPLIGFETAIVYYERKERAAGVTKYTMKKMISFALDGITSFSIKPLRIISMMGLIFSALSSRGLIYGLISYFAKVAVPGWTAIVCSIWLLGGVQLLCLGVVGEYIGKITSEVKKRPRYIIEEITERQS